MKRPKRTASYGYFIRRSSHVDESRYFNDDGQRVWFEKAAWARWFMRMFDQDQKAVITHGPILAGDVPLQKFLVAVLPETVTPQEFIKAIEQTLADIKAGRDVSDRAAKAFLLEQYRKHSVTLGR